MRVVIFFVLVACAVFAFIIVDQFPGLLEGLPEVQRFNWKVRDMLGLKVPDSAFLSDSELENPEKIYRQQTDLEAVSGACGMPPENPWAGNAAPSEADIERYRLALKVWEYCRQQALGDKSGASATSAGGKTGPYGLPEYPE